MNRFKGEQPFKSEPSFKGEHPFRAEQRTFGPEYYALGDPALHMESDFADRFHVAALPVRRERKGGKVLSALGIIAAALIVFQLFFRYEYLTSSNTVFRIDRVTHQVCRVNAGRIDCSAAGQRASFSTSTSTSTSISVSK